MAKQPRFVSRKEAAAEMGFTRQRLEKLIKDGRVEETDRGIDIDKAKAQVARTLDPVRRQLYVARSNPTPKGKETAAKATTAKRALSRVKRGSVKVKAGEDGQLFDFAEARAKRESFNAYSAEAKYKQMIGELLPAAEVRAKEFAVARMVRDRVLGLPARCVNFVPPEAMRVLTDECERLVRELSDEAAKIAEMGPPV